MQPTIIKVYSVAQMVSAETDANKNGHPYATMMEIAGRGVADAIAARFACAGLRVLVLVGSGNNGGDGLVAGRYLAQMGVEVSFYLLQSRPKTDENWAKVVEMGLETTLLKADPHFHALGTQLTNCDLLLDALLGTGVARPISGRLADLLRRIQQAPPPHVVAVDCPSGLNCDSGALDPLALPAELTVTFAGPKHGHFLRQGVAACGEIEVIDIGIDPALTAHLPLEMATAAGMATLLPRRAIDGHKGTFGFALIAGGSADYWGAPLLAARGALRTGAGLVAVAVPAPLRVAAAVQLPEVTLPDVCDGKWLGRDASKKLIPHLSRYHALLIGPGLGTQSGAFLESLLAHRPLPPLVIDADGLNWLAEQPDWHKKLPPNSVLTPHPGEMRRLVVDADLTDRIKLAGKVSAETNHIIVLKGAFTIIAAPNGRSTLIPVAHPILAVAGSGDVLAGIITALIAQGLAPYDAARLGAWLHAQAGRQLAKRLGDRGALAREVADEIPSIFNSLLADS